MLTARKLKPELGPNIIGLIKEEVRLQPRLAARNPAINNSWYVGVLRDVAAARFAAANGWRLARQFRPAELGKRGTDYGSSGWGSSLLDHPLWFAAGRRNIAIVSQPYGAPEEELRDCARHAGLVAHVPPNRRASFWNPGFAQYFVLTRPGVDVQWLPEQEEDVQ